LRRNFDARRRLFPEHHLVQMMDGIKIELGRIVCATLISADPA
jgi:hypothetical protein